MVYHRSQEYKYRVRRIIEELRDRSASSKAVASPQTSVPETLLPTTRGLDRLLLYLEPTAYQVEMIQNIVNAAIASEDNEATVQSLSLYLRKMLQTPRRGLRRRNHVDPTLAADSPGDKSIPLLNGPGRRIVPAASTSSSTVRRICDYR